MRVDVGDEAEKFVYLYKPSFVIYKDNRTIEKEFGNGYLISKKDIKSIFFINEPIDYSISSGNENVN